MQSNIRELEGALTRILAFADLCGLPITNQLIQTALADLLPQRSSLETSQVLEAVAYIFGISTDELIGRSRTHDVALPRQVAMYLMREEVNASLPQIGEALGGRDHTTVMYACRKGRRHDRARRPPAPPGHPDPREALRALHAHDGVDSRQHGVILPLLRSRKRCGRPQFNTAATFAY